MAKDFFHPIRHIGIFPIIGMAIYYVIYYPLILVSVLIEAAIYKMFSVEIPQDVVVNSVRIVSIICTVGMLWTIYKMMKPDQSANHKINTDGN